MRLSGFRIDGVIGREGASFTARVTFGGVQPFARSAAFIIIIIDDGGTRYKATIRRTRLERWTA